MDKHVILKYIKPVSDQKNLSRRLASSSSM